jgi:HAD superfamily hydrolase (TIGR01509 family)
MAAIRGRPWPHTWARFRDRIGLTDEAAFRGAYREVFVALFRQRARYFDDAVATVDALRADGVPLAVCTSSSRGHLERVLDLGLRDAFEVTVAADDTTAHKPEPGPYLEAAHRLGVYPGECSAAEDSTVGVASAKAAGMWTVGIVRPGHDNGDVAAADVVVDELTVGALYRPR